MKDPRMARVLSILRDFPEGASMAMVAERAGRHPSSVLYLLRDLVREGWAVVERRPKPPHMAGPPTHWYRAIDISPVKGAAAGRADGHPTA